MRSRRRLLALLGTAAVAAAALPIAALSAPGAALPDLRADAPEDAYLQVYGDGRLLLRFDGFVTNVGGGPLDITGNPSAGSMAQRRYLGNGEWAEVGRPSVTYEEADGHNHWHLMRVMRYSLRRPDGPAEVAPAQKVGFCLYDLQAAPGSVARRDDQAYPYTSTTTFCERNNRAATFLSMGVSAGWRDVYNSGLALQWVDVSNTAPGTYRVAAEADPNNVVVESDENNPPAFTTVNVAGHLAQPFSASVPGRPTQLSLAATTVTNPAHGYSPGSRVFRVESAPAHGALSVPVGGTTTGAVTYTPDDGYVGPDSFRFSVRDSRGYPRTPPQATASLSIGARQVVTVGVSGAPASLTAGTSAQLTASVANADGRVTWSIDGDPGDGSRGTISAEGLYIAPATPPAGPVTVRATSAVDPSASGTATMAITAVVPAVPAPIVTGSGTGGGTTTGTPLAALTKPRVARSGRTIVVRVAARRAGTLGIVARRGSTKADSCVTRLTRGRAVVCRMRVPRALATKPLRITVVLKGKDGSRAVRTLVVRP